MTTTRDALIGFIDELYVPQIPSGFLQAMIDIAKETIATSILLFASGHADEQPDVIGWLSEKKLLKKGGIDAPPGKSVMIDSYEERQDEVDRKKAEIDRQGDKVKDSAFKAFSLRNKAFRSIKNRFYKLDEQLRDIRVVQQINGNGQGGYLPLHPSEENRAMQFVLDAVRDVYDIVVRAYDQMDGHAREIDHSRPSYPESSTGNGDSPTGNDDSSGKSRTGNTRGVEYVPTGDTVKDILGAARHELGLGVAERNKDNRPGHIDKKTGKWVKAPYQLKASDVDDRAWCASFATYTWKKAGIKVGWSNKNYVPALWKDAKKMGLRRSSAAARPGDMIVLNGQQHVGIVESVKGNIITTIEGNASNRVRRHTYHVGESSIVGVIKVPKPKSGNAAAD